NERGNNRQVWIGILVSVVSLTAVFFFIKPADLWAALKTAQYGYLVFTVLGIVIFLFFRAVRWRFMLNNDPPYGQVFHIQNIGYLLTMLLPLRLGDVARAILIGNVPPVTLARGISTMVVERLLDMIFMVTIVPFALAEVETIPPQLSEAVRLFGFAAVGGIVVLVVMANERPLASRIATFIFDRIPFMDTANWVRRVDDLLAGLSSLTRLKDGIILLTLSFFIWLPIILAYYMTLRAANLQPTIPMTLLTMVAAAFSVAAPSSPGQIGVFHAGVTFALTEVLGQPGPEALTFAVLYHAVNTITLILMGLVGLFGAGVTFQNVVTATQNFRKRQNSDQ
ncbi:MAG: flippase-like domain-containing protein, partial [Anaerolineales bacterium]|nr:flippase-like domain-containing protein [Anaerolineales bacterium]